MSSLWDAIASAIRQATGSEFTIRDRRAVGGGSINQAYRVTDGDRTFFVKLNQANSLPMFEAEALGLREIAQSQTIQVPQPLTWGIAETAAYLVLNWFDLGSANPTAWYAMGQQLAAMHRVTSPHGFGWHQANTIGATPQPNSWQENWIDFYREHRLQFQLRLAQRRGGSFPQANTLLAALPILLADHTPTPALVHGDLWSGNAAVTQSGVPVLLDPAVYYGDREVDIAMSELFGRFPQAFYDGYQATYPLSQGYERRRSLYNLYHIINHFNLFGGGYAQQANRMISQILTPLEAG